MEEYVEKMFDFGPRKDGHGYKLNKPLLLLAALGRCAQGFNRLASFGQYDDIIQSVAWDVERIDTVYPFGRLSKYGVGLNSVII